MVLIFTLKSLYTGSTYVAGPFDIFATTSGGVTTLIGNNISKPTLAAGVTISGVDDATTGGTVQSVDGTCSNSVPWSLTPPETDCFFYDVVVESLDLAMSDDDTVYFGYTNCNGEYQVNSQNNAGSWTNQFCGTNFSGAYIIQNGISNTGGSTANVTNTPCT